MTWFLSTRLGRWLSMIGAGVVAVGSALLLGRRQGRRDAKQDAKEADYENADAIRDNVRSNLDERMRQYDDSGWRDE